MRVERGARLARVLLALGLATFTALAVTWARDRAHAWQTPHWPPNGAVPLRGEPALALAGARRAITAVAVNPACAHCLEIMQALADSAALRITDRALVALIVDTPLRPSRLELAPVRAPAVVWDSAGVWRHRWGRRRYGEVFRFDAHGLPDDSPRVSNPIEEVSKP
ncbi:MAG: hypothetical protein HOP12_10365 [Candidatus Eisenbacteria bacterium]|uniref:Uncharacterized protein n=1 Tax=Eiseniibacteriota bacterium TaxID=2212470 RepID=A0A849SJE1_UNCEI|nr:hypothetical protein [Candidatus Eisenbacteria bacterium]